MSTVENCTVNHETEHLTQKKIYKKILLFVVNYCCAYTRNINRWVVLYLKWL